MTTRRDLLTGLAALPIIPAIGTAEAATVPAAPAVAGTVFLHEIDRHLAQDLDTMEAAIQRMRKELLAANIADPVIRSGILFLMRCHATAFYATADIARFGIEDQRREANEATKAAQAVRDRLKAFYDECAAEAGA